MPFRVQIIWKTFYYNRNFQTFEVQITPDGLFETNAIEGNFDKTGFNKCPTVIIVRDLREAVSKL